VTNCCPLPSSAALLELQQEELTRIAGALATIIAGDIMPPEKGQVRTR
jgi:hypothetical protein